MERALVEADGAEGCLVEVGPPRLLDLTWGWAWKRGPWRSGRYGWPAVQRRLIEAEQAPTVERGEGPWVSGWSWGAGEEGRGRGEASGVEGLGALLLEVDEGPEGEAAEVGSLVASVRWRSQLAVALGWRPGVEGVAHVVWSTRSWGSKPGPRQRAMIPLARPLDRWIAAPWVELVRAHLGHLGLDKNCAVVGHNFDLPSIPRHQLAPALDTSRADGPALDPHNLPPGWPTLREAKRNLSDRQAREKARAVRRAQGMIQSMAATNPANAERTRARLAAWVEGVFDTSEDTIRGAATRNNTLFAEGLRLFRLAALAVEGFGPLLEAERVRRFLEVEGVDAGLTRKEVADTIKSAEKRARAEGPADLPHAVGDILRGGA
jgi:hypothetical protein